MKRFKKILVVTDSRNEGQIALKRAVALAKRNRARLTLVEVVEKLPRDMQMLITSIHLADIQDMIIKEKLKELNHLISPVRNKGIPISARVQLGTPFIQIIREVLRNKHDLVMITAEGGSGLKDVLFGTTTMHLMRKCPCPVWAIKTTKRERFSRILAAVNLDPSDEVKSQLNAKIMQLATSLAQSEKSKLHVIHTWIVYGESFLSDLGRIQENEMDKVVRKAKKMHKTWLEELLEEYGPRIPKSQVHLMQGEAGKLIPEMAKKKRIELIVMGTVGRTGVPGLFIGNTAEKILQKVNCSVLAVKPDGFISPVKLD
jgi:nucleotide-binding universal stress UspA family protein